MNSIPAPLTGHFAESQPGAQGRLEATNALPTHDGLGDRLIFLFSQPRSGSTMLQQMLGRHPAIHTLSEPWILLPPFLALRPDGYGSDGYWGGDIRARVLKKALSGFIQCLPDGEQIYCESVRLMCGHLYASALKSSDKRFFLDKTPLYYHIIPEIHRTFPKAKHVFLWRNPLAVLNSIIDVWTAGDPTYLRHFKGDLVDAPRRLREGIESLAGNCLPIHFEELVSDPTRELRRVCQYLEIDFVPEMIEYGRGPLTRFAMGDPVTVYQRSRPDVSHADRWRERLRNPQTWRLTRDYLRMLGSDTVEGMGYSFSELELLLQQEKPWHSAWHATLPLECYLNERSWLERLWGFAARLEQKFWSAGIHGACSEAGRRIAAALRL
jgi:Sulfotransferase family